MWTHLPKTLQLVSVRWWNANAYYAISLTEALNAAGVLSYAAGRENSPPIQKARQLHLPVFSDIDLEALNPLRAITNLSRLRKFIRREAIDLINAHRPEDVPFAALMKYLAASSLPVIRTVGDVRPPRKHLLNYWLHRRHLDHLIFCCRAMYEKFQAVWPIFEGRSTVIYSAIDTEAFRPPSVRPPLRRELGFGEDEVVVGIIARLSPVKDHHTFLRAAAQVARKAPQTRFLISGEAAQLSHEDLRRVAGELGIEERVVFLPRDERIDIRDLIGTLDVGVVASRGSEVICRVAVEYMALARPVVVTDVHVLPEIVQEGENGFVVPARDAEAMAERILRLVEQPELRRRMGDTARRMAEERFSYPVLVEKTLEVYEKALAMGRK
ncbi:MAG: glycosyltransferase family 1 protein [Calditrichaeota bacterium]|nr:MAG: glycosyltransferase family 1 protein [Calditrichota bacterium]